MKKVLVLMILIVGFWSTFANETINVDELLNIAKEVKCQLSQQDANEIVNFLNEMYFALKGQR